MDTIIFALVEDLLFLTRIQETARKMGIMVKTPEVVQVTKSIADAQARAVILDLNHRSCPVLEIIRALKMDPDTHTIPTVGFVSHVQSDLIAAAREAGCDIVMARSAFVQQLPELLRRFATGHAEPSPEP